ncbi:DUF5667 domain-containing protein [Geodermatophilus sp. URMC 64]
MGEREEALVTRLRDLGRALDGEPDPEFRAMTRARLVAMAAVRTPEPEARRRFSPSRSYETAAARWRGRLTAGLAGAAVAVTALAGLVAVSTGAQPGDPLYGLKRGTEQTQLALAGDATRGRTLLDFASTRLHELDTLLAQASPQLVVDTLRTMDAQTTEGAAWLTTRAAETDSDAPLKDLLTWADGQSAGLSALAPEVPEGAREALNTSLDLLGSVTTRATQLQGALSCPAGPAVAGTDPLGPLPAACDEEAPSPSTAGGGPGTVPGEVPPEGAEPSGEQPAPGAPATPSGGTAANSSAGSGGGSDGGSGSGSGGSTGAPSVPQATVPSVPSLPTPGLPLPPLPGTGDTGTGSSPGTNTSSPPAILDTPLPICLPPILC